MLVVCKVIGIYYFVFSGITLNHRSKEGCAVEITLVGLVWLHVVSRLPVYAETALFTLLSARQPSRGRAIFLFFELYFVCFVLFFCNY